MTQDEIYEMVRQSDLGFLLGDNWMMHHEFVAFAHLVAAKEREALAQPEQFCDANCVWTDHHPDCKLAQPKQKPIAMLFGSLPVYDYPTPPQRTWVGLTDEEIQECYSEAYKIVQGRRLENAFYKAIEAKLKERNT